MMTSHYVARHCVKWVALCAVEEEQDVDGKGTRTYHQR
jgi:hypothetical protein